MISVPRLPLLQQGRTFLVQDERKVLLAQRTASGYATAQAALADHGNDLARAACAAASDLRSAVGRVVALLPFDPAPLTSVSVPTALKAADALSSAEHDAPKSEIKGGEVVSAVRLQSPAKGAVSRAATVAAIEKRHVDTLLQTAHALGARLDGVYHPADALAAAVDCSPDGADVGAVIALTPGWTLFTTCGRSPAQWRTWPRTRADGWSDQIADHIKSLRGVDATVARRILLLGGDELGVGRLKKVLNVQVAVPSRDFEAMPILWWLVAGLDRASTGSSARLPVTFKHTARHSRLLSADFGVWDAAGVLAGAIAAIAGIIVLNAFTSRAIDQQRSTVATEQHTLATLTAQKESLRGALQANIVALGKTVDQVAAVRTSGSELADAVAHVGSVALAYHTWFTTLKVALHDTGSTPIVATVDGRSLQSLGAFQARLARSGYDSATWSQLTPKPGAKGAYLEIDLGLGAH